MLRTLSGRDVRAPSFQLLAPSFQLLFDTYQKIFNRFIDATLQSGANPRLAHQTHTRMQFPGTLAAQFDLLRNVDLSGLCVLFKL